MKKVGRYARLSSRHMHTVMAKQKRCTGVDAGKDTAGNPNVGQKALILLG